MFYITVLKAKNATKCNTVKFLFPKFVDFNVPKIAVFVFN